MSFPPLTISALSLHCRINMVRSLMQLSREPHQTREEPTSRLSHSQSNLREPAAIMLLALFSALVYFIRSRRMCARRCAKISPTISVLLSLLRVFVYSEPRGMSVWIMNDPHLHVFRFEFRLTAVETSVKTHPGRRVSQRP